ncbi:MAG: hypothetical protein HY762_03135 [Planctomycetes bacterium]|nr:hypothetical protein [Planctomycetota bacterium]
MRKVLLDKGYRIEKGVVVGYKPGRTIADTTLQIGKNAHIRSGTVIYGGFTYLVDILGLLLFAVLD